MRRVPGSLRRPAPPAASAPLPPSPPPRHQAPRSLPLPPALANPQNRGVLRTPRKDAGPTPPPAPATSAPPAAAAFPSPSPPPQEEPPRAAADDDPSASPPPAADEKPSTAPPTDAAGKPAPAREARRMKWKFIIIRNRVPESTLRVGEECAPDKSSTENAALDEAVGKERSVRESAVEKPAAGCDETLLGQEKVGGGALVVKLAADSDACVADEAASMCIEKEEQLGMSERQRRRMMEVFVGGLHGEVKEEDVRAVFARAGEITEVRMIMDARTRKNRGYCFVRYRESAQAKKAALEFCKVEICGILCQVEALDVSNKIVLGNIDKKWKKEDIVKLLQKTGVENIDTVTLMDDCNNPDYNCGNTFIGLGINRDALMAYRKLSKTGVFGRCLNVTVAWADPLIEPNEEEMPKVKSIFVEGTPTSWDQAKMIEIFKKYGVIQRVALAHDIQSAKRSDFAFIHYTTHEAAILCLESFNQEELADDGSKANIRVSLAKPVQKGKQKKEDKRIMFDALWHPASQDGPRGQPHGSRH